AALAAALGAVVARHEVLRTTFPESGGRPFQRIAGVERSVPPGLPFADLLALPRAARSKEARRLARAEAGLPFDLERGPVLRALLVRLSAGEHELLFAFHHIACDDASAALLTGEIATFYRAAVEKRPAALPALGLQYADFAVWQRAQLEGSIFENQLAWWRGQLAGSSDEIELPVDRLRPAGSGEPSGRGGRHRFDLAADLAEPLRALALRKGATPFMALLAAFAAQLARYGSREDLVVGAPVADRGRVELEPLAGCFLNLLPLRLDLGGEPGFDALIERSKSAVLGAFAHRGLPYEKLVAELAPYGPGGRSPLFRAVFSLQSALPPLRLPGLSAELLEPEGVVARFDLTLGFQDEPGGEGYRGVVEYSSDLFDPSGAQRVAEHFRNLLAGALAAPGRAFWELPLLAAVEERELLVARNATAEPAGSAGPWRPVHLRVGDSAEADPAALAIASGVTRLPYGALYERSARLGLRLARLGVGPEARVAIVLERSPELALAALAVLSAGGAYVPLD